MRLTLRTLLAWLDDTLPPAEVRQIGQQVTETPIAQELVDRIHRVTRQRRLTVPPGTGHDGVDPNIVAGYLGDELPAEVVAEYEKRCLTSDVTLAEVASVHQILSLLGQKAKVPNEAKQRMYHLIRGRESVAPATPRPASKTKPNPEAHAHSVWSAEPLPKRSLAERYGPLAAVAALLVVLCWSAVMSIGPKPAERDLAKAPNKPLAPAPIVEKPNADAIASAPTPKTDAGKPEKPADGNASIKGESPDEATPPAADKPKGDALPATDADAAPLPAGAAGSVGQGDFLLLRYNPETRAWGRLAAGAELRDRDRLVNLPSSLAPLQIGSAKLTLVGNSEVKVLSAAASSSRFELIRGRARVAAGSMKESITVPFDAGVVTITLPPNAVVGLERLHRRTPGDKLPSAPELRITAAEGTITAESGAATETLTGSSIRFMAPNSFREKTAVEPAPDWMATAAPTPAAQEREKALARYLKPERSPLVGLVEAVDDPDEGIRSDAIAALGAIGPLDLVVDTMSKKDDPSSRKAAIRVLRDVARRDADSAKALREQLVRAGGSADSADNVETMLVGFSAREAEDEATAAKLITLLKHEDVGVRELAIESLQAISHRGDRLGYDPDKPQEIAGQKAWQDLLNRKELRGPATPKAR